MRRLIRRPRLPVGRHHGRRGVSLVEVLMSLGLMSIGIAFIAGIFPLAALRTLRATNLTNSTILRFNAEAAIATLLDFVGTERALIHNPDLDVPDMDGDGVPDASHFDRRTHYLTEHNGTNYIVDPLGYLEFWQTTGARVDADTFGYNAGVATPLPATVLNSRPLRFAFIHDIPSRPAPRLSTISPGGTDFNNFLARARSIVTLPDTFNDIGEAVAASGTTTSAVLPSEVDLATVNPTDAPYRALIFNTAQDRSESRLISTVAAAAAGGGTITWVGDLPFTDIGLVKVDVPKERYTWLLSVRKRSSGPANVDVVVFLNRSFATGSEQIFEAEFRMINLDPTSANGDGAPGTAGVDDDQNGTSDDRTEIGFPGSDDLPNNRVVIRWPDDQDSENDPFLQRGSYIFDTSNSIWYRMQSVESQTTDGTTITARVVLDEAIKANNTEDLFNYTVTDPGEDANGNGVLDRGGAMTPRGVIAVYPLGLQ